VKHNIVLFRGMSYGQAFATARRINGWDKEDRLPSESETEREAATPTEEPKP
jgi:hypothetical protein